ncbi:MULTISPECIES: mechanosensitive ion channel domain-containing protein [unclassified Thioalkalivibrio]|uniref:mechanosensitive ion channel domain-containing protein n=1 Tax=unclassified Thioalkalivibrio TaxID=2621013 RepID=UPI0003657B6E|nr:MULTISPECIES: mechanosensitive ion channel domain-containing protein [unclassified Thioalkalivibrio]
MSPSRFLRRPFFLLLTLFSLLLLMPLGTVQAQEGGDGGDLHDALIEALENEEARERLLETLRAERTGDDESTADDEAAVDTDELTSIPRQIAQFTQSLAEGTVQEIRALNEIAVDIGDKLSSIDPVVFGAGVLDLAILIVLTIAAFLILRRLGSPMFAALDRWVINSPEQYHLLRALPAVLLAALIDFLIVILAWVGGYGLALFVLGESGEMLTRHSLFLNAFLLIEVTKAALRLIFATRYRGLRLLPMAGDEAAYWNAWLARLVTYIGYGLLLLVPLANNHLSSEAGRSLGLLVMLTAFLYAAVIILQNRQRVHDRLILVANRAGFAFTRMTLTFLANAWHWIALIYFLTLAIVSITRPEDALPFMAKATGQTVLAAFIGVFVANVLSQIIGREIRVPDETRMKFPMLEARLNSYIPKALKTMRLVILLIVLAVIADAWGAFNLGAWIASDTGMYVLGTAISVALILIGALAIWLVFASWIEHRLSPNTGEGEPGAREKTLLTLFRNAVAVVLAVMTAMIVLAEIGVNIGPLLAGAGVLGLAVGFGAQKLVQDIITGVFIQLEKAINTGDVVTVAGMTGVVEKLTIRSMGLRDLSGTYHLIPFSSVDAVSNYMREYGYHVGEYGVAYREDIDEVIVRLREAFEELKEDPDQGPNILDEMEVHGVTALADSSVNVRIRIKALPGTQFGLGRAFNRLVKKHFDAAGIEIPFPHQTIYFGQEKDGSAPPAHLRLSQEQGEDTDDGRDYSKDQRARPNPKHKGDYDEAED